MQGRAGTIRWSWLVSNQVTPPKPCAIAASIRRRNRCRRNMNTTSTNVVSGWAADSTEAIPDGTYCSPQKSAAYGAANISSASSEMVRHAVVSGLGPPHGRADGYSSLPAVRNRTPAEKSGGICKRLYGSLRTSLPTARRLR